MPSIYLLNQIKVKPDRNETYIGVFLGNIGVGTVVACTLLSFGKVDMYTLCCQDGTYGGELPAFQQLHTAVVMKAFTLMRFHRAAPVQYGARTISLVKGVLDHLAEGISCAQACAVSP